MPRYASRRLNPQQRRQRAQAVKDALALRCGSTARFAKPFAPYRRPVTTRGIYLAAAESMIAICLHTGINGRGGCEAEGRPPMAFGSVYPPTLNWWRCTMRREVRLRDALMAGIEPGDAIDAYEAERQAYDARVGMAA